MTSFVAATATTVSADSVLSATWSACFLDAHLAGLFWGMDPVVLKLSTSFSVTKEIIHPEMLLLSCSFAQSASKKVMTSICGGPKVGILGGENCIPCAAVCCRYLRGVVYVWSPVTLHEDT